MIVEFNQPPSDRWIMLAGLFYAPALLVAGGVPIFLLEERLGQDWAFGLSVLMTLFIALGAHLHFRRMLRPMSVRATATGLSFIDVGTREVDCIDWQDVDHLVAESTHGDVLTVHGGRRVYLIRQFPLMGPAPEGFAELCGAIDEQTNTAAYAVAAGAARS